ncbi:MAG: hypothetical protein JSV94_01980 [Methanobacteriota archaeon]|nr:MAG: hypothetical protein JSV94_01980 [Euryarchaeota archaeon]
MPPPALSPSEMSLVREHTRVSRMTLAVVRTPEAPQQMQPIFEQVSNDCSLPLLRVIASPLSDFGFAEFYSDGKMLIMLFIGGGRTELVSVSEMDESQLKDLEDSVSSSNVHSSLIRDGT